MNWKYRLLSFATATVVTTSSFAQQAGTPLGSTPAPDPVFNYTKKDKDLLEAPIFGQKAYFKRHFGNESPKFELRSAAKFEDFAVDNKLELSLRSYLQLVLANNVDIDIQRLGVEIQRNAITRAYAPFDPVLIGSFNSQRTITPTTNQLEGAATLNQLSQPTNLSYQQTLANGINFNTGFTASKLSTNNSFAFFNPALNAQLVSGVNIPLLRNRGTAVNKLPITIARSRLRIGQENFLTSLLQLMTNAEQAYWDVIGARESLRVQEKALELSSEALKRSRRELELGAISPLDIYQPEANYASAEIQVLQSRYRLQQAEDALRRQMGADLDSRFKLMPINLTEAVTPPTDDAEFDREKIVERAVRLRPEIRSVNESIVADDLSLKLQTNLLRPDFSLRGSYISTGRGGTQFLGSGSNRVVVPGGFGDALDQMFGFGFPIYSFGLQMRLPIRDRAATANYADAVLNKRRDLLTRRSTEQNVRQQVLNAISQVESSKASVKLAAVARDFAQKQLDAEQKKYDLGTSVIFFVLDAQTRLVNAEAALVNQTVQYRRNQLNLLRVTGELLDERGIKVQ
jgi:outer membrane protein TolC